ncbi:hypothetical protein [Paracoccus sp. S1E-3]|uniref:hypothetical protein n=1 Tax=Paracoccus sp. S1E-3 TaxID=2756130 RepID=UPI0015EEE017|nr:hypothetical protein [Paracoccus sp. S1E-3]MBA4490008.1 hypothetical protein [Paracoccus sp. S1E-3]
MTLFQLTVVAFMMALPAFAQDAAPDEPLPPATTEQLPPGGQAPVDQIPAISDVAPDGGAPDATAMKMACHFKTQCVDTKCTETSFAGKLTIISDGAGMAEAQWDDDKESLALSAQQEGAVTMAFSTGDDPVGQQILTIAANGEARFTFHKTDPISSTSYLGTCEASK